MWFSSANAGGHPLVTPNGIADGPDGAIYVVNAGVSSTPQDAIYRTVDLNGDGDANDAGEATVWLNLQSVNAASSAFDLSFIGGVAYLTDTNGGTPDTVYRIEDKNGDGDAADAGEATVFISDTESYGAPIDIANAAQGNSILTYTWIGNAGDPPRVYRLTDLDGSGAIDDAAEAEEIWNWDYMPEGFAASVGFSIAGGANGDVIITTNAGDASGRNVVRLTDLNNDGDFMDVDETVIALSNAIDAAIAGRPRAVTYYDDGTTIGHPLTYVEAGSAVEFAADLTIGDGDLSYLSGATVKIVGGFEKGDFLDVDIPQGSRIKVAYDAATGKLTLAGKATAAEYQAVLQGLTFDSRKDNPSEALRHISLVVFDERGLDGASGEVATTLAVEADPAMKALFGSDRADRICGTQRADAISALDGADKVAAGNGADRVSGGDGDDRIEGGDGDDALAGDDGNDALDGGRGNDILAGGAGCDTLSGGRGSDQFVFAAGSGKDVVLDFNASEDEIVFAGVTLNGIAVVDLDDAAAAATAYGRHGVKYTFDGGETLVLLDGHGGLFA